MAESEMKLVAWEPLKEFAKEVFTRAGMPPEGAEAEAGALIWANLRAVDSHGVLRIPWYLDNIEKGVMNPKPNIQVIRETPATILLDADRALGSVVTIKAVDMVVEKAKQVGIGWALIRNLTHQGALGYYSQMMAEKGMAGIVFVCNPPNMAPFGARAAGVHNSPIAISVPARRYRPLNLDMATSVAAGGKLLLAIDKNLPIPEGWVLDKEGNPTTDPRKEARIRTRIKNSQPRNAPSMAANFTSPKPRASFLNKNSPSMPTRKNDPPPTRRPIKDWFQLTKPPGRKLIPNPIITPGRVKTSGIIVNSMSMKNMAINMRDRNSASKPFSVIPK